MDTIIIMRLILVCLCIRLVSNYDPRHYQGGKFIIILSSILATQLDSSEEHQSDSGDSSGIGPSIFTGARSTTFLEVSYSSLCSVVCSA